MKFRDRMGALLTALAFSVAAGAQTPPAATTCTTAPTGVSALNIERTVPLNNVLTTLTPNAPANVLASIAGGALEIREQLIYNPGLGTVTVTTFLVAPGSPNPTPSGVTLNTVESATIQISQILTSCTPVPSLLMIGTVTQSPASGIYGSFVGAPAAISLGYTTDTPAKINNVAVVVAGRVLDYSSAASGTLTFPAVTVVPPGSTGAVVVKVQFSSGIVIPANSSTPTQVPFSPLTLDATQSTGNGALTYTFSYVGSPVSFTQVAGTPGKVNVYFPIQGIYTIVVNATDSQGNTGTPVMYLIQYTGRPN